MHILKTIVILSVVLGSFFAYSFISDTRLQYSENDPTFNRNYWSEIIDTSGELVAYKKFKQKNNAIDVDSQHLASHVFGELLFEKSGVAGISTCDSSFGFGCYHGFFTRAVSENGVSIIKDLDSACVNAYTALGTGCQHGIGHGIMEYFGYSDIQLALDACKETTQLTPLLGCSSGVFMEYRTPLVYGEGSVQIKPRIFDETNPYDPCERIVEHYKPSCYFELADWWSGVLGNDYEYMGSLCNQLRNPQNKRNCFLGIGATIASRETFDIPSVISICSEVGFGESERDCRSGASWGFFAEPEFRDQASIFCEGYTDNDKVICIKNADLTEGLDDNHL